MPRRGLHGRAREQRGVPWGSSALGARVCGPGQAGWRPPPPDGARVLEPAVPHCTCVRNLVAPCAGPCSVEPIGAALSGDPTPRSPRPAISPGPGPELHTRIWFVTLLPHLAQKVSSRQRFQSHLLPLQATEKSGRFPYP